MPRLGDNALLKLGPILERFAARQPSYRLTDGAARVPRGDRRARAATTTRPRALERVARASSRGWRRWSSRCSASRSRRRASFASEKINVIPSHARLAVDCRVPPGLGVEAAQAAIDEVVGAGRLPPRVDRAGDGQPLADRLAARRRDPRLGRRAGPGRALRADDARRASPTRAPSATPSRECAAYGFFPHRVRTRFETDPLIHSADERIDVRDLEFATRFFRDVCERLLGG